MTEERTPYGRPSKARSPLYLRLVGVDKSDDSVIPLDDLARTLVGLQQVISEFARITKINGQIQITAKPPQEGSFVLGVSLETR